MINNTSKPDIFVDYEYGTLKEVILGVPLMIYPDPEVADWAIEALKVLPYTEQQKMVERSGKSSLDTGKYEKMEAENEELTKIFENHDVMVWRPEVMTREQLDMDIGKDIIRYTGATFQYSRDPMLVIGDNVIETHLATLTMSGVISAYYKIFLERVMGSNAKWYSMPKPSYSLLFQSGTFIKDWFPLLEGGDVLVLGNKILVGNSKNPCVGSNEMGYLWLKSILEPQGYDVERVPLVEQILHLDVALSTVKPGLAIICPDAMVNGIPSFFDDWKMKEVTLEEAQQLATNGMPIDTRNYILPYNDFFDGKDVQAALELEGINVYRIFFGNHTEDGGAIRCSTHPLVRRMPTP